MADGTALRTALVRLSFSANAAAAIVNVQGVNTIEALLHLEDEQVENLCKVVRRPGGSIDNPAAEPPEPLGAHPSQAERDAHEDATAAALRQPARIPDPGLMISLPSEENLKLACYLLRHQIRIGVTPTPALITMQRIRAMSHLRTAERKHEDPELPKLDKKDWPRVFDAIVNHLTECLGVTGIPLAYVVRETEAPMAPPTGGWPSVTEQMIGRAPFKDAAGEFLHAYLSDRAKVWNKFKTLFENKDDFTIIRPAMKTRDGRLAYTNLLEHHLGQNRVNTLSAEAERQLQVTHYHGDKRTFTFDKYVKIHMDQHAILEGLVRHGYAGIDPRTKVRHLMNGITPKELMPVQTQVFSTPALQTDFQAVVNLYKMTINSMKPPNDRRSATVAAASTSMGDDGDADMSVADRYYSKSEYDQLTPAQKNGLRLKRKSRGHKSTGSKRTTSGKQGNGKRVRFAKGDAKVLADKLAPRVASMVKSIVKSEDELSGDEDDSDSDTSSSGNKSSCLKNRNNKALKRRGSKKGKK